MLNLSCKQVRQEASRKLTCIRVDTSFIHKFRNSIDALFVSVHLPVASDEKFPLTRHFEA